MTAHVGSDHAITPVPGSARQLDGQPASLLNPAHYPVEALCIECGRPIRVERYYLADWRHIERFTTPRA